MPAMLPAARALVRPRAICPESGEVLCLEDLIEGWLAERGPSVIEIVGGAGMGKSTALLHLRAVAPPDRQIVYLDDVEGPLHLPSGLPSGARTTVVYTTHKPQPPKSADVSYRLAAWSGDELIEYLLAAHAERCASVMQRLGSPRQRRRLRGNPELCRIVLDRMAEDATLSDLGDILRRDLGERLRDVHPAWLAHDYALYLLGIVEAGSQDLFEVVSRGVDRSVLRLLRHPPVKLVLAADRMVATLEGGEPWEYGWLDREMVQEMSRAIAGSTRAIARLHALLADERLMNIGCQPMAASMLHACAVGWAPAGRPLPNLERAYLEGASWPAIDLARCRLTGADLEGANLEGASLEGAFAQRSSFRQACLRGANIRHIQAADADLQSADMEGCDATGAVFHKAVLNGANLSGARLERANLTGADLTAACLCGADATGANLCGAQIAGADFTGVNFSGAVLAELSLREACLQAADFTRARLKNCDMEGLHLSAANFGGADLSGALLTGSSMPGGYFRGARLRGAGLAHVNWERADLRVADFRESSFYLGSTRNGLVGSPIASEGSRTGFYTDEYDEQPFKAPEEIRKANLRGADLRGAIVTGVDFYLVDLREAKYSARQGEHFRQCGAILFDRASQ